MPAVQTIQVTILEPISKARSLCHPKMAFCCTPWPSLITLARRTVCIGRQCHYDQTGNKKPSHFFHNAFWIINRIPTMPHHHNICNKLLQKQGTRPLQALHINGTKKRSPNPWDYQDFTFGLISMCLSISLSTKERICKFKHMRTTQKKRHTTTLQNTAKASFMQKGYSADTK